MNYCFQGSYTDQNKQNFQFTQEDDLQKICRYLSTDINSASKITFKIFDSREGKQNADPHHSISRASARFKEMTIYRFWLPTDDPHYPHEITHLVAHIWSKPYKFTTELDTWDGKNITKSIKMVSTSFMQEGLAIAIDEIVFNHPLSEEGELNNIDDWCRQQIDQMPKNLTAVINLDGFNSFPNKIVVPFAASISKYLLLNFGLDKYKQMYVSLKETNKSIKNVQQIEAIYQISEKKLLNEWKEQL